MDESQFRQLLDKYLQGKCSPEESELLHRFYDSFQEKQEDTLDLSFAGKKMNEGIWRKIAEKERQHFRLKKQKSARSYQLLKIAASLLLILGVGLGVYFTNTDVITPEIAWIEKTTQKGQRATVTLADGTKVYLNARSKISFPEHFSGKKREVILEGEAFFEVARNVKKPFIIQSEDITTTVLGTSFNIRSFEDEPQVVSVATGKVKVNIMNSQGQPEEVVLTPNQQAFYDGKLHKKEIDINKFIAWKHKIIRFDDVSLAEAVSTLENWFGVSIQLKGENIKDCKISGQYINENLVNILESIEHILGIQYEFIGGRNLIIEGKGCNIQN